MKRLEACILFSATIVCIVGFLYLRSFLFSQESFCNVIDTVKMKETKRSFLNSLGVDYPVCTESHKWTQISTRFSSDFNNMVTVDTAKTLREFVVQMFKHVTTSTSPTRMACEDILLDLIRANVLQFTEENLSTAKAHQLKDACDKLFEDWTTLEAMNCKHAILQKQLHQK